jgi:hypothetical protein
MTRTTHRITAGAAALITAALLAACTHDKNPPPLTTSSSTTATPTTSAPPTPEEQAKTQAIALAHKYYKMVDEVSASLTTSLDTLHSVASGDEFMTATRTIAQERIAGRRAVGEIVVVSLKAGSVDLTNQPNANPRRLPTVHVTTCIDATNAGLVDSAGKPVPRVGGLKFFVEQLTVDNYKYPALDGWTVSKRTNKGVPSCAGQ